MNRSGNQLVINLTGSIGDTTPLFTVPLGGVAKLTLDLSEVTSINSIGVKNWIMWTVRIPKDCNTKLINCPFVIASQASTVVGFCPQGMTIDSIRAPYSCENCSTEITRLVSRGTDYEYASGGSPKRITITEHLTCTKCGKGSLEPDFILEKTFKFLG